MKILTVIAVLTTAVSVASSPASEAAPSVRGTVSSRFMGSSTLHEFSGTAPVASFAVEPSADGSWSAMVDIPVAQLTTENSWRDANMRTMLHADQHPALRAEFAKIVPEDVRTNGRLPFRLTIVGLSREMVATVQQWQQTDREIEFEAEFSVSLSAFGLEAPRTLFIVVDDPVRVTARIQLRRE